MALSSSQKIALAEFKRQRGYLLFGLARVEQCDVTLAQTESILSGAISAGLKTSDLEVIINLKHAHEFLLQFLKEGVFQPSLEILCELHGFVAFGEALEWGNLRGFGKEKHYTPGVRLQNGKTVLPTKTDRPEILKKEIQKAIEIFQKGKKEVEDGIMLFCRLTRLQGFFDGNKRTSFLFTNACLVAEGKMPLIIPADKMPEFNEAVGALFEDNTEPMQNLLMVEYKRGYSS